MSRHLGHTVRDTEGRRTIELIAAGHGGQAPHIHSRELFGAGREIVIEHNDREYRLRVTAQGKLILTA